MASLLDDFFDEEMIVVGSPDCDKTYDGCLLFIRRWLKLNGYPDPETFYLFKYRNMKEMRVLTKRGGGFVNLVDRIATTKVGLIKPKNLEDLCRGDIGIVRTENVVREKLIYTMALGIKDNFDRWALKSDDGLSFAKRVPIIGWHVIHQETLCHN